MLVGLVRNDRHLQITIYLTIKERRCNCIYGQRIVVWNYNLRLLDDCLLGIRVTAIVEKSRHKSWVNLMMTKQNVVLKSNLKFTYSLRVIFVGLCCQERLLEISFCFMSIGRYKVAKNIALYAMSDRLRTVYLRA